jgi:hypothetical protein
VDPLSVLIERVEAPAFGHAAPEIGTRQPGKIADNPDKSLCHLALMKRHAEVMMVNNEVAVARATNRRDRAFFQVPRDRLLAIRAAFHLSALGGDSPHSDRALCRTQGVQWEQNRFFGPAAIESRGANRWNGKDGCGPCG